MRSSWKAIVLGLVLVLAIVPAAGCDLVAALQPAAPEPTLGEQVDEIARSIVEIIQAVGEIVT